MEHGFICSLQGQLKVAKGPRPLTLVSSFSSSLKPLSRSSKSVPLLRSDDVHRLSIGTYKRTRSMPSWFILSLMPLRSSGSIKPVPFVIMTIFFFHLFALQYSSIFCTAMITADKAAASQWSNQVDRVSATAHHPLRSFYSVSATASAAADLALAACR